MKEVIIRYYATYRTRQLLKIESVCIPDEDYSLLFLTVNKSLNDYFNENKEVVHSNEYHIVIKSFSNLYWSSRNQEHNMFINGLHFFLDDDEYKYKLKNFDFLIENKIIWNIKYIPDGDYKIKLVVVFKNKEDLVLYKLLS